jgi:hypothetical protein
LLTSAAPASHGVHEISIGVPAIYISQRTSSLNVTLTRTRGSPSRKLEDPLTVDFSASPGSLKGGAPTGTDSAGGQFTAVNEFVIFPPGQATETVSVPIHAGAPNPGLVPIVLSVTHPKRNGMANAATVYLVSGPAAIPPSIVNVRMVKKGIAVTFSKPMAPASVENVRNYSVEYTPSQEFSLADLTGVGLIQRLNKAARPVALRRAIYEPSSNTVTLIPKVVLPPSGTYQISSPSSLRSKRARLHRAQPLTDLQGNALNLGGGTAMGAFSISIRRGHPYVANQPTVWDGR